MVQRTYDEVLSLVLDADSATNSDSFTSKPEKGSKVHTSHEETYAANFEPGFIKIPGYHKKNEIEYQKDIDRFVKYVLNHCLSVL